jgi:hypothetical protein
MSVLADDVLAGTAPAGFAPELVSLMADNMGGAWGAYNGGPGRS